MDVKKYVWWLFGITIALIVMVIYVYTTVSDCCGSGPGKGPIIVIQPTGSSAPLTASWTVGGAAAVFGATGQLREDAFGDIEQFTAKSNLCTGNICQLQSMSLTIRKQNPTETHTVKIERTTSGQLAWSVDDMPLTACDFASSAAPPDCASGSSGLPPEFNGTIMSALITPAPGGGYGSPMTAIDYATMQAKK